MVNCSRIDIGEIKDEDRLGILNYVVVKKGVKPHDLGVTSQYINAIRHGRKRVSDDLLCKLLSFLTYEELASLLRGWVPDRQATPGDIIRVIATAKADPDFRQLLLSMLYQHLGDYLRTMGREWRVGEGDIEAYIMAMRLKGVKDKTLRDRLHYIRKALAEMDWVLSPEGINEYLYEVLNEDGPNVARHVSASLKSLLKQVLRKRDPYLFGLLYNSFTTIKSKPNNRTRLPTINELRQVLTRIESIEAKTYFLILAETGLRPGEPFLITMDDVDLEHGMLRIGKVEATKKVFVAFLRPETLEFIKSQYLPRRGEFINNIVKPITASGLFNNDVIERFKSRFLPFDQGRLKREIKEAAR